MSRVLVISTSLVLCCYSLFSDSTNCSARSATAAHSDVVSSVSNAAVALATYSGTSSKQPTYEQLERLIQAVNMSSGGGAGVTADWVRKYVNEAISNSTASVESGMQSVTTNGVTYMSAGTGDFVVYALTEYTETQCVTAKNVTQEAIEAGITNGVMWAQGTNGFQCVGVSGIVCSNGVYWCGRFSTKDLLLSSFYDGDTKVFDVGKKLITQSEAKRIRGE